MLKAIAENTHKYLIENSEGMSAEDGGNRIPTIAAR
jgi:hypothetical protein